MCGTPNNAELQFWQEAQAASAEVERLLEEIQKLSRVTAGALGPVADVNTAAGGTQVPKILRLKTVDQELSEFRAAMPVDADHGPLGNPEAEMRLEINLLRAENERLKIKLSRMCCDA
jgi:hypothetical protein